MTDLYERIRNEEFTNKLPYSSDPAIRAVYNAENRRLVEAFRDAVEHEHGTAENPKRDKLWELAWEHGHAAGLSEVLCWYEELVELVN